MKALFTLLLSLFFPQLMSAQDGFMASSFKGAWGTLPYQYLAPKDVKTDSLYPVVLFLHGSGERGSDNLKQLTHGASIFLEEKNRATYPCHVYFPQCPDTLKWVNYSYESPTYRAEDSTSIMMHQLIDFFDWITQQKGVDQKRIYVMGLSMGGYATWEMAAHRSTHIAAIVPICGGADTSYAKTLSTIPTRIYHGEQDKVISVKRAYEIQEAMTLHQNELKILVPHELIIYPEVQHDSWEKAFLDEQLFPWLFDQRK